MAVEPRYKVRKDSGSRYAYIIDSTTGREVVRFGIFKGDGWQYADRYCEKLNAMPLSPPAMQAQKE